MFLGSGSCDRMLPPVQGMGLIKITASRCHVRTSAESCAAAQLFPLHSGQLKPISVTTPYGMVLTGPRRTAEVVPQQFDKDQGVHSE